MGAKLKMTIASYTEMHLTQTGLAKRDSASFTRPAEPKVPQKPTGYSEKS